MFNPRKTLDIKCIQWSINMCCVKGVILIWDVSPLCHFCTIMEGTLPKGQAPKSFRIYAGPK
jgi:hypothetical protein